MSFVHAVVLGLTQGLTEFLPVSSSAHLRLVAEVLGWDDPGAAFTAVTQLGTLAAVLVVFRADLLRIAHASGRAVVDRSARRSPDADLAVHLVIATVPIALLGLVFKDVIEDDLRSLGVIAVGLVAGSIWILIGERRGRGARRLEDVRRRDAIIIGAAQSAALVPGISRSGATISAGLLAGLDAETAARYSFLLSVPAVALSGVFELRSLDGGVDWGPTVVATVIAFAVGYASIRFLLRLVIRHGLRGFVPYRLGAAALAVILAIR